MTRPRFHGHLDTMTAGNTHWSKRSHTTQMVTTAGSARWTELFLRLPSNNASQLSGPVFTVVNDDEMIEMTAQGGQASTFIRLAMVCIMLRHLTRSNRSSLDR